MDSNAEFTVFQLGYIQLNINNLLNRFVFQKKKALK